MPALVFLNRKWLIASDDLMIPCLAEAFLRLVWLTAGLIIMMFKSSSCHESQLGDYYMYSCIGDLLGTSCLSAAISFVSSRGSVLEEGKRKFIENYYALSLLQF
ncbi:diacylglycerol lipase-beta-like [Stegodyphus dumicola]|uniref:diacylglycerol lipase-beta-like n=1 Tax=Stegodyphus dumicola TaxID=202533 RepID=UPI0015AF2B85|nr:diacylglycerol lipase-beta-like [Stegodyphus dumicola]